MDARVKHKGVDIGVKAVEKVAAYATLLAFGWDLADELEKELFRLLREAIQRAKDIGRLKPNEEQPRAPKPETPPRGPTLEKKKTDEGGDEDGSTEHRKNKRKSTEEKHEKGQNRKTKDQGGEKGDRRRPRCYW